MASDNTTLKQSILAIISSARSGTAWTYCRSRSLPANRAAQTVSYVMCDAGQYDQPCIHTSLSKLRDSRGCRIKRYDLVVARMNRPEPEADYRLADFFEE